MLRLLKFGPFTSHCCLPSVVCSVGIRPHLPRHQQVPEPKSKAVIQHPESSQTMPLFYMLSGFRGNLDIDGASSDREFGAHPHE